MSHTLFIADLHLCNEDPIVTANFLHFLRCKAQYSDALYILGDLFESWIGDDDPNPLHNNVAQALRQLNIPCFFIHGNRDFMLGQRFASAAGMILLPEEKVLELYGKRLLIMHGDTLCTDDESYQCYRRKIQQRWLQRFFLALPLTIRQSIARKIRNSSYQANSKKKVFIMDVNSQAVIRRMCRQQTTYLIHGHTHRPAVHHLMINTKPVARLVLGAWNQQGSMIKVSHDEINLIFFPF